MKKLVALLITLIMVVCLAGCETDTIYTIKEDGGINLSVIQYYSLEELNMLVGLSGEDMDESEYITEKDIPEMFGEAFVGTKVIDGVTYYGVGESEELSAEDIGATEEQAFTPTEFVIKNTEEQVNSLAAEELGEMGGDDLEGMEALASMMTYKFTFNMPYEIVLTNGELSADKKSVTFNVDLENAEQMDAMYAYTAKSDKIIDFSGLTGNYSKKSSIKVVTYDKVKSIYVNGKKQTSKKTVKLPEDGKYEIKVVAANATKTFNILKDATKPVVKGVKNEGVYTGSVKITYSDDGSGIKYAKLNGKKIKKGKTVSEPGEYKLYVYDKAGNKTTVKFTIK